MSVHIAPEEAMAVIYGWLRPMDGQVRILPEVLSGKIGLSFQKVRDGEVVATLDYFEDEGFSA